MIMQTQQQQQSQLLASSAFTQPLSPPQPAFASQSEHSHSLSLSPPSQSPSLSQSLLPSPQDAAAAVQLQQVKKQQVSSSSNNIQTVSHRQDLTAVGSVRAIATTPAVLPRPRSELTQQLRFPWKLHLLLEQCELQQQHRLQQHQQQQGCVLPTDTGLPVIVSWLPDGKSFKVHDKIRFVKEIMPSFFGTQSFKTFQRNLNLWYVCC